MEAVRYLMDDNARYVKVFPQWSFYTRYVCKSAFTVLHSNILTNLAKVQINTI